MKTMKKLFTGALSIMLAVPGALIANPDITPQGVQTISPEGTYAVAPNGQPQVRYTAPTKPGFLSTVLGATYSFVTAPLRIVGNSVGRVTEGVLSNVLTVVVIGGVVYVIYDVCIGRKHRRVLKRLDTLETELQAARGDIKQVGLSVLANGEKCDQLKTGQRFIAAEQTKAVLALQNLTTATADGFKNVDGKQSELLAELSRIKEALAGIDKNNADGIQHLTARLDSVLQALVAIAANRPQEVQGIVDQDKAQQLKPPFDISKALAGAVPASRISTPSFAPPAIPAAPSDALAPKPGATFLEKVSGLRDLGDTAE